MGDFRVSILPIGQSYCWKDNSEHCSIFRENNFLKRKMKNIEEKNFHPLMIEVSLKFLGAKVLSLNFPDPKLSSFF